MAKKALKSAKISQNNLIHIVRPAPPSGLSTFSKLIIFTLRNFHQLGPLGRVGLVVTNSVCLSPSHAIFFYASHWSSNHMTRSRPLIGQPSFPTIWWWWCGRGEGFFYIFFLLQCPLLAPATPATRRGGGGSISISSRARKTRMCSGVRSRSRVEP